MVCLENTVLMTITNIPDIDLLDEFSATKADNARIAPKQFTAPFAEPLADGQLSDAATDDFSRQLQEQMAALLGNVDETPEMRKEIEVLMHELGATTDPGDSGSAKAGADNTTMQAAPSGGEDGFQKTIRKTMERMQNSGEQAGAAAAASDDSEDILAQMLKEMQSSEHDGTVGEEGFSQMLMSMMEQLTNKEILYEPMKELHDKFPGWMSKNKDSVRKDDLRRYEDQQRLVIEIVAKFDDKRYTDSNTADRQYIIERMQQVISLEEIGTELYLTIIE